MKRSVLLLLVYLIGFSLSSLAQDDLFLLPRKINYELIFPKRDYSEFIPTSDKTYQPTLNLPKPVLDLTPKTDLPANRQILSEAYSPLFDPFTPMHMRMSPMALDFDEYKVYPMGQGVSFVLHGTQQTFPGAGGHTFIQPSLRWKNEKFEVSGGAFAGRFQTPLYPHSDMMGGVNVQMGYQITDWMNIRTWGQYAAYDKQNTMNPFVIMNPMMNHTQVGGAMEFKITDDFGIGVGVNYEFNPMKRRLVPKRFVYPIFY